jgi:hypothetical protein
MEENQEVEYRIGIIMGLGLVAIAFAFDFVEIILDLLSVGIAGTIKDIAQVIFFPAVFLMLKAPFWKGKKAAKKMISMITAALVGFIPIISTIMPEVTISVMLTIYYTRSEDREVSSNPEAAKKLNKNITRYKRVREKVR